MEYCGRMLYALFYDLYSRIRPGLRAVDIDAYVGKYLRRRGLHSALPAQYPAVSCISVNEVAAHGVPDTRILKDGDVLSLDLCFGRAGWLTDGTWSYVVGKNAAKKTRDLVHNAWRIARAGVREVQHGVYLRDIAEAISSEASVCGLQVFSEFCGHGIGKSLHEHPRIAHVWKDGENVQLLEGAVFTIEPIVTYGSPKVRKRGWEFVQIEGNVCAQFEHVVAICKGGPRLLSFKNISVKELPELPPF